MAVVGSRPKRKPCSSNCATCDHKAASGDDWCYMFKVEPEGRCYLHTAVKGPLAGLQELIRQAQQISAGKDKR